MSPHHRPRAPPVRGSLCLPHCSGPDPAHNLMPVGGTDVRAAGNLTTAQVAQAATGDAY